MSEAVEKEKPKGLYQKAIDASGRPGATKWMATLSFTESSFFVIPPDIMLVPMMLAKPERAYWNAFVCTISSIAGGVLGFFIGLFLLHQVALPLIDFYEAREAYDRFHAIANSEIGVLMIATKALTPIPYKVIAIAAGAAEMNLFLFVLASFSGRGLRFFFLAWLAKTYGQRMKEVLDAHGGKITGVFIAALVGGFLILPLL